MTRLQRELFGRVSFPKDVALLRESIYELADVSSRTIQRLYAEWSEIFYDAAWLSNPGWIVPVTGRTAVEEFGEWLRDEVGQ